MNFPSDTAISTTAPVARKECHTCGQVKVIGDFYLVHKGGLARMTQCKLCVKAYAARNLGRSSYLQKLRDKQNPEKRRVYTRRYRAVHKEARKAYARRHGERCNELQRLHYRENPEIKKQAARQYCKKYPERVKLMRQLNYQRHRQERLAGMANWYKQHPEYDRIKGNRRRAAKLGLGSDLTLLQWEAIRQKYAYRCAYCGKEAMPLTLDHVIPLVKGGKHTAINVVPACRSCNSRKGARQPPCSVRTYTPEELLCP